MTKQTFLHRAGQRIDLFSAWFGNFWRHEIKGAGLISWLWLLLAIISVIVAANMFRYETMGDMGGGIQAVRM